MPPVEVSIRTRRHSVIFDIFRYSTSGFDAIGYFLSSLMFVDLRTIPPSCKQSR